MGIILVVEASIVLPWQHIVSADQFGTVWFSGLIGFIDEYWLEFAFSIWNF